MTFYIHIDKLNLVAQSAYNNTVKVNMLTLKAKIAIVTPIITSLINGIFETPFSIEDLLVDRGLEFLDLKEMELMIGQGYAQIQITPQYRRNHLPNLWQQTSTGDD